MWYLHKLAFTFSPIFASSLLSGTYATHLVPVQLVPLIAMLKLPLIAPPFFCSSFLQFMELFYKSYSIPLLPPGFKLCNTISTHDLFPYLPPLLAGFCDSFPPFSLLLPSENLSLLHPLHFLLHVRNCFTELEINLLDMTSLSCTIQFEKRKCD